MTGNREEKYDSPVKAIFTGISDLFRKPAEELKLEDLPRLEGKKVLITGSSSGLGYASAVELARRGAHVIMAVRSGIPQKGEKAKKESGSDRVDMLPVDLSDPASIAQMTLSLKEKFGKIDILICNAAVVTQNSRSTREGLDEMFAVNYLAKYLLIHRLVKEDCFKTTGPRPPKIIIVNSESHRNPREIDWEGFGIYEPYGIKKSVSMYGYYKLLLLILANEFSRRLNPGDQRMYSVSALCPGPVNSNIAREAPALFQPLLKLTFRLFFRSSEQACRPVIYLAAAEEQNERSMDYLFLMNRKSMDPKATDPENGQKLWKLTEALVSKLNF